MASFTMSFSSVKETSAKVSVQYVSDSTAATSPRWLRLSVDGAVEVEMAQTSGNGTDTSGWTYTLTGLAPGESYDVEGQLGWESYGSPAWLEVYVSKTLTTKAAQLDVAPWTWSGSNGSASDADTVNTHRVFLGELPVEAFRAAVWNDLVDKAAAVRAAKGLSWYSGGSYLPVAGCKLTDGGMLTAAMFNTVRYNLDDMAATGLTDRSPGDEVLGSHFIALTTTINAIIEEG